MARSSTGPSAGRHLVLGPFQPPHIGGARHVRIYFPRGYDPTVQHRALYLFDGQNVFDDAPSFAGGWHVHDAVDKIVTKQRRAPVVVGIDHGGDRRIEELSPFDVMGKSGKLDRFLDWVTHTVMPLVSQHANIGYGPVNHAVGGSSLGGLAAMYAHYQRPEVFGGAIAMSPSFWLGGARIFGWIDQRPKPMISRVYLDCGAREGRGGMLRLAEQMATLLRARGYDDGALRFRADARGTHSESAWRRRAPAALRFMYTPS